MHVPSPLFFIQDDQQEAWIRRNVGLTCILEYTGILLGFFVLFMLHNAYYSNHSG